MVTKKVKKKKDEIAEICEIENRITEAMLEVEKKCGNGTIMVLGKNKQKEMDSIPTGSLSLDNALGIGGVPKGRVMEIYGPESSGKTTMCLSTIGEAQKKGLICAFIDAEHALDLNYAEKLGVDPTQLLISQPDYGEQALEIADTLVQSGKLGLIVIDSVAALVPKVEIDGEMSDNQMGLQARMMSKAMRKLTAHCSRNNTSIIFINQIRMKIGVMFGSPEVTTGGNALKFFSSIRMDIRKIGQIKEGDKVIGNRIRIKIVKNKVAPPFRIAEFELFFNEGVKRSHELLDLAVENNIISKAGSWYSYGDTRIGQGKDNSCNFLEENPSILSEIENSLFSLVFLK